MTFYMPVRVYDEPEAVSAHSKELASLGSKALIVTGRNSAFKCGAYDDVARALKKEGIPFCVFPEVEENPSVETVVKGSIFGHVEGADFVIGLGGGSPMDAAKAIAFLMKHDSSDPSLLYDSSCDSAALPVAAVPTTCGTGSEVTGVSVITVHEQQTKRSLPHRIFPALALVDGKYLKGAPVSVIRNTSVDALAHLSESFLSAKADDYSRAAALYGLRVWGSVKEELLKEEITDDSVLSALMRASTFAGIAIAQTGTTIPHALSYIVTYDLHMPHGRAVGYFLPAFLAEAGDGDRGAVLEAAGFTDISEFYGFMRQAFPSREIPEETLTRTFNAVVSDDKRMNGCTFSLSPETLERIIRGGY